jgi:methionyl-tRNA synthetase
MPGAAARLLDALAVSATQRSFADLKDRLISDVPLPTPSPIFPRYVEEAEAAEA